MTSSTLRIAMAQINTTVGAISDNAAKILDRIRAAREAGAQLVSFPELAVCGYPPEDLLFHPRFVERNLRALADIAAECRDIAAVVGFVDRSPDGILYNAAATLLDGRIAHVYHKVHLPNYGVFDEKRYFQPGTVLPLHEAGEIRFGVSICEDIWVADGPSALQAAAGAGVLVNINASPYHTGKRELREAMLAERARAGGVWICYNNLVGGQDELVFDGQGMVISPQGEIVVRGRAFEEDLIVADLDPGRATGALPDTAGGLPVERVTLDGVSTGPEAPVAPFRLTPHLPLVEEIHQALLLGIRDYFGKNGFSQALIGLSGGIDSALVAALAVEALGPENVTCVFMSSRYSSEASRKDARAQAKSVGVELLELPIDGLFSGYLELLAEPFADRPANEAEENIQARIRGTLLMALSNKFGWLVLTTGNKSEMAVGYATLYGDMAGGFAVIKDLPKQMVYKLSHHLNETAGREVVPHHILVKEPSAELRENQKDSDSLPPYEVLDPILEAYVEASRSLDDIAAMGFDRKTVRRVIGLVDRAEYKRRQAPPGIRITPRAFGRDRRMPITNRFRE